jgi:glycosyltransferase involved in cell wall biosynthesis
MACGSLFVAAPTPATKEIAVGAEVEWTPLEALPMASAFARVWADRSRQARAALVNREVASGFSWDKTAKRLHELLGEMAEQNARASKFM